MNDLEFEELIASLDVPQIAALIRRLADELELRFMAEIER